VVGGEGACFSYSSHKVRAFRTLKRQEAWLCVAAYKGNTPRREGKGGASGGSRVVGLCLAPFLRGFGLYRGKTLTRRGPGLPPAGTGAGANGPRGPDGLGAEGLPLKDAPVPAAAWSAGAEAPAGVMDLLEGKG
jgi:hypothetical protein